jgi:hypothetical protein
LIPAILGSEDEPKGRAALAWRCRTVEIAISAADR